jgi:PAS domain S-box-containing protein
VRGSEPRATIPGAVRQIRTTDGPPSGLPFAQVSDLARAAFDVSREYVLIRRTIRVSADVAGAAWSETRAMAERPARTFRSGDALFAFDADLAITSWNRASEELTGVSADEAVGRYCWEILGGHDERGNLVCHRGCSNGRLAREGWPVRCQGLVVKAREGKRRIEVSTVAVEDGDRPLFLHVMVPRRQTPSPPVSARLTPRQEEVLGLLADGVPAKVIAARLGIAEATVRNHIRAILVELGTHSQLEAIAKARHLQLVT